MIIRRAFNKILNKNNYKPQMRHILCANPLLYPHLCSFQIIFLQYEDYREGPLYPYIFWGPSKDPSRIEFICVENKCIL